MPDHPLRPRRSSPNYAVRKPLVDWLASEAGAAATAYGRYRVLDVGCGDKRYLPLFATRASSYVGVDRAGNAHADLLGSAEAIPVDDASFEVAICTQVLEHVADPLAAVRELHRVVRPGGRVLVSTHGVQVFHPNPEDLWRWTHTGLERLFGNAGKWSSVAVEPGAGLAGTLGMLMGHSLDLLCKRGGIRPASYPIVAALNAVCEKLDAAVPLLRTPLPGSLFANYHVRAVR